MDRLNRRLLLTERLLPLLAIVGAGVFGPARAAPASHGTSMGRTVAHDIAQVFSDPEGARSIGRCYLAAHPAEAAGARRLAEELRCGQAWLPGWEGFRRALADRRRQDLESGDVVVVGGWVLARTEARACALTVL